MLGYTDAGLHATVAALLPHGRSPTAPHLPLHCESSSECGACHHMCCATLIRKRSRQHARHTLQCTGSDSVRVRAPQDRRA